MPYELHIKKIDNGYILEMPDNEDDTPHIEVIEELTGQTDAEFFATSDEEKLR